MLDNRRLVLKLRVLSIDILLFSLVSEFRWSNQPSRQIAQLRKAHKSGLTCVFSLGGLHL